MILAIAACGGGDPFETSIYSEQPEIVTFQSYLEANSGLPSEGIDPILAAGSEKGILTVRGLQFKDSNGNGSLEPYEDWRLTPRERATDLVGRMATEEKLAMLNWRGFGLGGLSDDGYLIPGLEDDGTAEEGSIAAQIANGSRHALNAPEAPMDMVKYMNNVQGYSERLDWGIPMIMSQDPTHDYWYGNETPVYQYSTWPFMMGLGAINDLGLTRRFGEIVRDELRMSGYHVLLGPQADLATEPRWARIQHLIHADADITARHIEVLVRSMQAVDSDKNDIGLNGIITVLKHFPGAGSNEEGMDSHTFAGRYGVFPGGSLEEHLKPFRAAMNANVGAIMMAYSIIDGPGLDYEPVGAAYEYRLATELLREELGFTGTVVSDHSVATSAAWGVEDLTVSERLAKMLNAGTFQAMPGDSNGEWMDAYERGLISDETLNNAAIHALELQFKLGLFENPYVDITAAEAFWDPNGRAMQRRMAAGYDAMRRAMVLVENAEVAPFIDLMPVSATNPDYVEAVDRTGDGRVNVYFDSQFPNANSGQADTKAISTSSQYLQTNFVADINDADIAVIRINARGGTYFGTQGPVPLDFESPTYVYDRESGQYTNETIPNYSNFGEWHFGDWSGGSGSGMVGQGYRSFLGYRESLEKINMAIAAKEANPGMRLVLGMTASRPGIIEPYLEHFDAVFIDFAATDSAFLDIVFWQDGAAPQGILPVEIPSSTESVRLQLEDLPGDTPNPTYEIGYGLEYNTGDGYM